ncbi:gliding motility-associated C-terminal domain-containing protein [Flavobacterium foetidum]|uniref:gliding motility-associated C-terminal domain-containing protein n=1 Tax=Flavobacterium foetidum TaxID=2026681 RepID=UPI001074CC81|nr:gliding motility-associated C-terminal domain-containing protein [Flavobacterium foetidum]KAF2515584.1 gliding motility-associated C-terminal domain-containing protein [Flavobacterium foetidum]
MMKKDTFLNIMHGELEKAENTSNFKNNLLYCAGCLAVFLYSVNSNAQFVNTGDVKVEKGTILSVYMDYNNKESGNFINDGQVHIFENWTNDGAVSYTNIGNGKTFFTGEKAQQIKGSKISNFQNILFENLSALIPFRLSTAISVNKNAEFSNGIIDGDTNGLMIFNEYASHTDASDLSFVDGKVQKIGVDAFEFPIGDDLYFRPSYHAVGADANDSYTAQYFLKNSDPIHPHSNKDVTIKLINNTEYWNVDRDKGTNEIVLSLTLDTHTTPSEFFDYDDKTTEVTMVRWDEASSKWVREESAVSDRISEGSKGAGYTKLLMGKVSGYGMFTMALVDKKDQPNELVVYNALSPNNDGINDTFHIKGIDKYPDNTVEIYNRWGVKVFEAKSYNESDNMFRGYSDGRATINRNEKLPTGTYYYILRYNNGQKGIQQTGYLYINNQ